LTGVFDMQRPADLLAKLRRELERFRQDPLDADHAFNFFVTADHMLDWLHPGRAGKAARDTAIGANVLLRYTNRLSIGAKHFDHLYTTNLSVRGSEKRGGHWPPGFWHPNYWATGYWPTPALVVTLEEDASAEFGRTSGETIHALELAERVYAYWTEPGRVPL
jgi:hypothetical protein